MSSIALFYPAPTELPLAEVQYLIGYAHGQPFERQKTIHAALNVLGFANAKLGSEDAPAGALPLMEEQTLHAMLMQLSSVPAGAEALSLPFDWKALARKLALEVLTRLLAG